MSDEQLLRKIKKNAIAIEQCERQFKEILEKYQTTVEDARSAINNPLLFTDEEWTEIQKYRKEIEEIINEKSKNIRDVAKQQNKFSERGQIQPHWLFVR